MAEVRASRQWARTAAGYEMAPPLVLKNGNPAAADSCPFPPIGSPVLIGDYLKKFSMLGVPA